MSVMSDGPAVDLDRFNPFDPAVQQCPFPHYAAMREQAPVFRVPGTNLFLVTRHDLVTPILRDTATFSSSFGNTAEPPKGELVDRLKAVIAEGWPPVSTMLTIDPPQHTRYRGTVAPAFTPKAISALRGPVEAICERLVDGFIDEGRIELVQRFAVPLPIEAIACVLNVPTERMSDFKRWSDDSIAAIGSLISDDERVRAQRGIVEFQHYFAAQLEQRRAEPRDDLLSQIAHAEIDDGKGATRPLDMAEMLSITQQLLVAGNETTTKAITEGVRLLAENPDQWAALRRDPVGRAPVLVEEVLRLATPTQGMFRLVTHDTEIAGTQIPAGATVVVVYAAANRDPAVFPDPDAFDPDRPNHKDHLAFGKGVHFCLGAPLSRLEMQVAFETLGRRLGELRLAPGNDLAYHPSFILRGLKSLEIEFTRAGS
ncbi:MAG TPA: cytochrome P450 [Acidimicrobiales bacterium]